MGRLKESKKARLEEKKERKAGKRKNQTIQEKVKESMTRDGMKAERKKKKEESPAPLKEE